MTATNASTLAGLAEELLLPSAGVAMAVGSKMVPRGDWAKTSLADGVEVIIIKATCGG